MSTIDANDNTVTEIGPSEDPATAMLANELVVTAAEATADWFDWISSADGIGFGAGTATDAGSVTVDWSDRFSSAGGLGFGAGTATDAGSATIDWSDWISSVGELVIAAGADNVVAAKVEEKF